MRLTLAEICRAVDGHTSTGDLSAEVIGVSTDSRTVRPGELFVPLRGEHFDGHEYIPQALSNGALACLSEKRVSGLQVPVIEVRDTLEALGNLASHVRNRMKCPVLAVTGSSGKTTTKEMLASILSGIGPGLKTRGNFNNLIGLPLTLFTLKEEHRWAVLEMGTSALGEIARLCDIAKPTVGIITNIGSAHLETLRSLEGVARAKGEMYASLSHGGSAVINIDDSRVASLPVANQVGRVLYGFGEGAHVRAIDPVLTAEGVEFTLVVPEGQARVKLNALGMHNVSNALAAAAAARAIGVHLEDVVQGLIRFEGVEGRLCRKVLTGGITLLDDSYNANPLSLKAGFDALVQSAAKGGRRVAVLGDMFELGTEAEKEHRAAGKIAAANADELILLGELARYVASGAQEAGMSKEGIRVVENREDALEVLKKTLRAGDSVLVKGSRGMKLDLLSRAIEAHFGICADGGC